MRVLHTQPNQQKKKSLPFVQGRLWLIFLTNIVMEKPELCGLHRNLQLQENASHAH